MDFPLSKLVFVTAGGNERKLEKTAQFTISTFSCNGVLLAFVHGVMIYRPFQRAVPFSYNVIKFNGQMHTFLLGRTIMSCPRMYAICILSSEIQLFATSE